MTMLSPSVILSECSRSSFRTATRRSTDRPLWHQPLTGRVPPTQWIGRDGDSGHACSMDLAPVERHGAKPRRQRSTPVWRHWFFSLSGQGAKPIGAGRWPRRHRNLLLGAERAVSDAVLRIPGLRIALAADRL